MLRDFTGGTRKFEIVHYSSEDILITSIGNKIKISKREEESLIKLPIRAYLWVFYFFRLSRRFLRLDKMNLFYVEEKEESIIFYQSKIYSYTNFEGLKK